MTLAEAELRQGRFDDGKSAVASALAANPSQREAAIAMACRLAEQSPDSAYPGIEAVADAALAEGDYAAAAAALHEFVTRVRRHIVALMRLVEICVDGGLEATMYSGAGAAGRRLPRRRPRPRGAHHQRRSRRPRAVGSRQHRALPPRPRDAGRSRPRCDHRRPAERRQPVHGHRQDGPERRRRLRRAGGGPEPAARAGRPPTSRPSSTCRTRRRRRPRRPGKRGKAGKPARGAEPPSDARRRRTSELAAEQLRLAHTYRDMGMVDDAIQSLERAARSSRQRFEAASLLGRLHMDRGERTQALDWFERAAEAPAPTPMPAGRCSTIWPTPSRSIGESGRALAVFGELDADVPGYRDVAQRIERLSRVQARG